MRGYDRAAEQYEREMSAPFDYLCFESEDEMIERLEKEAELKDYYQGNEY